MSYYCLLQQRKGAIVPLVIVTAARGLLSPDTEKEFGVFLQETVAHYLEVPEDQDWRLTADDIEVRFEDVSPRTVNPSPFSVEIIANNCRKRSADLGERIHKIAGHLRICKWVHPSVIDNKGGFVWARLADGAFEKL